MLSHALYLAVATWATCASADSIFAVDFDVIASRVAVNNGLTTYAVACPASSNTANCNFVQPYTLVQGPSTVSFAITVPNAQTATLQCSLPASTVLSCSATAITPAPSPITIVATSDFSGAGITSYYKDVSIVTASSALLTYSPSATGSVSSASGAQNATSSGSFGKITSGLPTGKGSAQSTGGVGTGGKNGGGSGSGSDNLKSGASSSMGSVHVVGLMASFAVVAALFC